jgi:hypothetical protein
MDRYDKFIKRVDLVQNQVAREKLAEEKKSKLKKKRIQQQNAQRFAEYQQILRAELEARIFANVSSTGGGSTPPFAFGNALQFDGVNDFVTQSSAVVLSSDFTISVWFKFNTITDTMLFSRITGGTDYIRISTPTNVILNIGGGFSYTVPTLIISTWYNLTISRISGDTRVYLNGVESSTGARNLPTAIQLQAIGYYAPTSALYFNGVLDEIGILSGTGATPTNATDLYNGGAGADFTTVMGSSTLHYKLNESGTATTAVDSSGNGNDGTLNNFPASGMWVAH